MAIKSVSRSSLKNNVFYRSLLAGNEAFDPSSDFLLEEVVLTSNQTSVEFTNLVSKYAAEYKNLQVRTVLFSGQANFIPLRLNGNDAASVRSNVLRGRAGAVTSFGEPGGPYVMYCGDSSIPSHSIVDISDAFTAGKNKTVRTMTALMLSTPEVALTSTLITVSDAINSIRIPHPNGFNFLIGSRFSLYGSK
jgi:hypothetical protein